MKAVQSLRDGRSSIVTMIRGRVLFIEETWSRFAV
jgi:hypothetical protein